MKKWVFVLAGLTFVFLSSLIFLGLANSDMKQFELTRFLEPKFLGEIFVVEDIQEIKITPEYQDDKEPPPETSGQNIGLSDDENEYSGSGGSSRGGTFTSGSSSKNQAENSGSLEMANQESETIENQVGSSIISNVYTVDLNHNLKNEFRIDETFYYNVDLYNNELNIIYVDVFLYSVDQNLNKIKFCSWKNRPINDLETMTFSCGSATSQVGEYTISAYVYKSDDGLLLNKISGNYKILGGDS